MLVLLIILQGKFIMIKWNMAGSSPLKPKLQWFSNAQQTSPLVHVGWVTFSVPWVGDPLNPHMLSTQNLKHNTKCETKISSHKEAWGTLPLCTKPDKSQQGAVSFLNVLNCQPYLNVMRLYFCYNNSAVNVPYQKWLSWRKPAEDPLDMATVLNMEMTSWWK